MGIDLCSHSFYFISSLLSTYIFFFIRPHKWREIKLMFHWCDPYVLRTLESAVHEQNVIDTFMTQADYDSKWSGIVGTWQCCLASPLFSLHFSLTIFVVKGFSLHLILIPLFSLSPSLFWNFTLKCSFPLWPLTYLNCFCSKVITSYSLSFPLFPCLCGLSVMCLVHAFSLSHLVFLTYGMYCHLKLYVWALF